MAADLILTPEADDDLTEAAAWYDGQRQGRAAKFLARVAETIEAVRRTPKAFTAVRGDYRRAVVRHFPYVVLFGYDEAVGPVTVYAVFHTSQDPDKLLRRLPDAADP
jgi:plasmid stabilization system protein ParE